MVTSKHQKTYEIKTLFSACFFVKFGIFKMIRPRHLSYFQIFSFFFSYFDYFMSNVYHRFFSLVFCLLTKKQLYLGRALILQIHLGIHRSNTGERLLYCYYTVKKHYFTRISVLTFYNRYCLIFIHTQYLSILVQAHNNIY